MKSYQWQDTAFARFAKAVYFALVVDCGCGKTFAAISIALFKRLPVIVIAPGHNLCSQWRNEIKKIAGDGEDVWVYNRAEERKQGAYYQERFLAWLKGGRHG
jgi:superfamily II DNA or RNA helicase